MTLDEAKAIYLNGDYKLQSDFKLLDGERSSLIERTEKYAGWTLPNVFPIDNLTDSDEMQHDFQSVGAEAVTNLSNKMMMALFPPSRQFFRMNLDDDQRAEIMEASEIDEPELEKAIAKAERAANARLAKKSGRVVLTNVMLKLIVTGNALLHKPAMEKLSVYGLRNYVITRDHRGGVVKMILRESKKVRALSDDLAKIAKSNGKDDTTEIHLYTCAQRIGDDKYLVWQELENFAYAHRAPGLHSKANLPWIPLTWNLSEGQDYGNGLVENYAGDFHSLSMFSEIEGDFAAVATDIKNLVNPAGMTDVQEIAQAASGAYISGQEADIFSYSPDVKAQTDFIANRIDKLERRIGRAFLLNSAVTRDAERVTAEEIRQQAQELEGSLGGVYSRIAEELQQQLAKYLMEEENTVFKGIEPTILTGLESLSRMSDVDRLRAMILDAAELSNVPEDVRVRLNLTGILNKLSAGHGVDTEGVINTPEQVKEEQDRKAQEQANLAGTEAGAVAQATGQA